MKKRCETCEFKGYSSDICKTHIQRRALNPDVEECPDYSFSMKNLGKTAVVGAGVGIVAMSAGIAAVPAVALKTLFGHVAVAKLSVGASGGVAGAGANIYRKSRKEKKQNRDKKRRRFIYPMTLKGGGIHGVRHEELLECQKKDLR